MSDRDYFHVFLKNLSVYFDDKLTKTKIDNVFINQNSEFENSDDENNENNEKSAYNNLKLVKTIKDDPKFLAVLMELSSFNAKKIRENRNFLSNFDDWNFFLKHINYNDYVNFTDCLIRLIHMDVKDEKNRKLSIYAARAYFILMSVPDSKVVGVFQIDIFQRCLDIFDILIDLEVKLSLEELSKFEILIIDYLNDIEFFLKFCFLNELEDLQEMLIKKLFKIVKNFYVNGFVTKDDYLICDAIYKTIEQMCKPCHGDLNKIYQKIFDETLLLYIYKQPLVTRAGEMVQCSTECSYIIQFGIKLYEANPEPMIKCFNNFAVTVITSDPDHVSLSLFY